MQHRTITGKILYTSRKPDRMGEVRGRETFTFTVHGDGKRILRAQCEIEEPSPTVLRDIVYAMDENDMPMDCFVRLTIGDRFMGAGLFIMGDGQVMCESYGPLIGRVSQTMKIVGDYDGFGTHPIQGDAYITKKVDVSKGSHTHNLRVFLPSTDHRGATPPIIAEANMQLAYVGEETVTVQAGTFACRHFRFTDEQGGMVSDKGAHPAYDLWVTADEDAIFVQGGVGGYMQTWYELVELDRS
ncbi:hypothetical protein [Sphingobium sp.]|uniref:hypothetical protein n=1 Tax=Sphingobium sp. TaxID=1912891 RepID=UPI003BB6AA5C